MNLTIYLKVFLASDPGDKIRESLLTQFEEANLKFRIFTHKQELNSTIAETQLRLEMTSITPLGVIVYSRIEGDYSKNLKKIMNLKIDRLINNANITLFADTNHSEIHEDRMINEEQSFEDLNGYEIVNRSRQISKLTNRPGIIILIK